jgi:flagellar basal body-associated protein FliL
MSKTASAVMMITLLLVGAVGGYFFSKWSNNSSQTVGRITDTVSYSPGDPFITNLKGSRQLLKTEIIIEMQSNKIQSYLSKYNYKVRNLIIDNLSSLTAGDLEKEDVRDILKSKIRGDLEEELSVDGIIDIYFSEFVTQ